MRYTTKKEAIAAAKELRAQGKEVKVYQHKANFVKANPRGHQIPVTSVWFEVR